MRPPQNPIEALVLLGFIRLDKDDPRRYRDSGGNYYLTLVRGPVRIALAQSESLFLDRRGAVIRAMDEGFYTLAAILVEPGARRRGLARQAIEQVLQATTLFGVGLFVEPAPLADRPMTREQLTNFYESLGFEPAANAGRSVLMISPGETQIAEEAPGYRPDQAS